MNSAHDRDPFVVFKPRFGRFMFVESFSAALGILIMAAILGMFDILDKPWLIRTLVVTLVAVTLMGVMLRRSRRIVIGDSWMAGPPNQSFAPTTIQFDTVDRARSGVHGGKLRIVSISGRGIEARASWYSPEDIEEIERLLLARTGSA
jgi:hypothetical protein